MRPADRVLGATLLAATLFVSPAAIAQTGAAPGCPALLAHTFPKLQDESPQNLCQYKGKVVLAVS